ncbi:MAG: acetyl-CoA synthetase, partial [bacterium]|nr:acetyl-CoA synthetase [bacterium]
WSPDKKHIVYYSDATGEYEIYLIDKDGTTSPRQLTKNSSTWKYPAVWSPDSKKLLFSDKKQLLQILDIQSGKITAVDRASAYDIVYYRWSHDSKWIVYTKNGQNKQDAVWVYSLQEGKPHQLTNDTFIDFNPVFSTCGQYIFFLSNRDFNLTQSSFENDFLYCKATKIFALPLKKDTTPLFKDRNDTEDLLEQASPKPGKSTKGVKENHGIAIDYKDCDRRIQAFPIANVGTLYPSPTTDLFSYLDAIDGGIIYSRDKQLFRFTFEGKKEEKILEHIDELLLSANKKKLLYKRGAQFCIVDLLPNRGSGSGALNLAKLTMRLEPLKEWQQIYNDGWRIFRDWFYAENMHGVDWLKIRKKYQALVPHVGHRADLDYIFGELIGESNTGHCYANYGEFERVKRVDTGLLGADLKADEKAGRYKITKIYKGENWNPLRRSPLTQPGINIQEGAYIISLNKHNLTLTDNPYRFLENTVGKRIPITVNSLPKKEGARTYMIKPIASELELFYHDWAESRRAMVDRLSGGKIGYIHLPNTAIKGTRELYRGMYAYFNKQALIIDDRYNGGGFIPQVAIGLLSRTTFNYWARRGVENFKSPEIAHDGLKAMLCNGYSSSGGDALPYYFRKRKLGPVIGTRTWGGLVGLTSNAAFADGGSFNVPTFGFYDNGKWEVEGLGVTPDIKVVDEPHLLAAGKDPCIEKAVEVLMKKLNANPPKPIKDPPLPDRSKWHEEELN